MNVEHVYGRVPGSAAFCQGHRLRRSHAEGAQRAKRSNGFRANPHLGAANFTRPVSLEFLKDFTRSKFLLSGGFKRGGVMTDGAKGQTEMAAEESGGHILGPALCTFPADKPSKYGCIHKSLNTHAFHTHSRQIQFPNQGLSGNPPYSSVCLHMCVCVCV